MLDTNTEVGTSSSDWTDMTVDDGTLLWNKFLSILDGCGKSSIEVLRDRLRNAGFGESLLELVLSM